MVVAAPLPAGAKLVWTGSARWIQFATREDKADYMRRAAEAPAPGRAAASWAPQFRRPPERPRAPGVLPFVQITIRYENAPATYTRSLGGVQRHGIEVLESSAVALQRGYGDCDVKARLFV